VRHAGRLGKEGRRRRAHKRRLVELWAIVEAWGEHPSRPRSTIWERLPRIERVADRRQTLATWLVNDEGGLRR
jgi:hypothetical protein